jgi:hypothetical protein
MNQEEKLFEAVGGLLGKYIGANNARVALKTFVPRAVGVSAEKLSREHLPAVLEAMLPMLRTFLGQQAAGKVIEEIKKETLK